MNNLQVQISNCWVFKMLSQHIKNTSYQAYLIISEQDYLYKKTRFGDAQASVLKSVYSGNSLQSSSKN
jgi:hypothetical protein